MGQTGPNKTRSSFSLQKMGLVPQVCHNFGRKNIITRPNKSPLDSRLMASYMAHDSVPDIDPFLQLDGLIENQTSHTFTFSF